MTRSIQAGTFRPVIRPVNITANQQQLQQQRLAHVLTLRKPNNTVACASPTTHTHQCMCVHKGEGVGRVCVTEWQV